MTNDFLCWGLATMAGGLCGGFYFYGLWWTLVGLWKRSSPKRWLAISYAVRMSVALLFFGLLIRKDVRFFFFALAGFFLMRMVLTRVLCGPNGDSRPLMRSGTGS